MQVLSCFLIFSGTATIEAHHPVGFLIGSITPLATMWSSYFFTLESLGTDPRLAVVTLQGTASSFSQIRLLQYCPLMSTSILFYSAGEADGEHERWGGPYVCQTLPWPRAVLHFEVQTALWLDFAWCSAGAQWLLEGAGNGSTCSTTEEVHSSEQPSQPSSFQALSEQCLSTASYAPPWYTPW